MDTTDKRLGRGFQFLNLAQALSVFNDNLYKLFLIYFLIDLEGIHRSDIILALCGAIFVLPFLLFSAFGGTLADRLSKKKVILFSKYMEGGAIIIGLIAFYCATPLLGYLALFFMGVQSALLGPSKYSIIPELVRKEDISSANGQLASFTYLAIIIGTTLASLLTQATNRQIPLAALSCLLIAIIGVIGGHLIPITPPSGSKKTYEWNFIKEVYTTLKRTRLSKPLFSVILSNGFFLFIGGFVQLNIIPYAIQTFDLPDVGGGYLFLVTALGIGIGSYFAGRISHHRVELGLVPCALFGMTICLILLGIGFQSLPLAIVLLFILGLSGGLYLVPLESFIQIASPGQERGQNVGANNFLGFVGVLLASFSIFFFSRVLKLTATQGFLALGIICILILMVSIKIFFQPLRLFFKYRLKSPS